VALALAIRRLGGTVAAEALRRRCRRCPPASSDGEPRLDLAYDEDSLGRHRLQLRDDRRRPLRRDPGHRRGHAVFRTREYGRLVALAQRGAAELFRAQQDALQRARER
jgi:ribonuclease PH